MQSDLERRNLNPDEKAAALLLCRALKLGTAELMAQYRAFLQLVANPRPVLDQSQQMANALAEILAMRGERYVVIAHALLLLLCGVMDEVTKHMQGMPSVTVLLGVSESKDGN